MKFLVSELMTVLSQREMRRNARALVKYLVLLTIVITVFTVGFHLLMLYEGQEHSWLTGVYWTLTVMSTLGFGDITFHSDLGRLFSVIVLVSGIILLLIVLPFAFIRYFYAPWLEAQVRLRAPREVPESTRGHVLIAHFDEIARELIERLRTLDIECWVLEQDAKLAAAFHADGYPVIAGQADSRATYVATRAADAAMMIANVDDPTNTSITLTVREEAPHVPISAFVEDKDAIDILELSGATHVVPLKHRLGEQLAGRVSAGNFSAQIIGRLRDLLIAEFPVHGTSLTGSSIRETRLRELTGLHVVAYWDHGKLMPARPEAVLSEYAVMVVVGTEAQVTKLNALFKTYQANESPVLVIGGGKVGRAALRALKKRDVKVHLIEENPALEPLCKNLADRVFIGDAADINVVTEAGIAKAPSVLLTTNDDATNIYLAVYCRKLNPDCRIVSRITHERNLEAIHRAGADFVLSSTSLGVKSVLSVLQDRELVIVGEGFDLFAVPVPPSLAEKTLAASGIGAKTGLNVIGIEQDDAVKTTPSATTRLAPGTKLLMLGTLEQRREFAKAFAD